MLRLHALCGVSVVAIQAALLASTSGAFAQGSEKELPAVSVDAPKEARKLAQRSANAKPRATRPAAANRSIPVIVVNPVGGETRASLATPSAVARYQLPQQSFSITAKEVDETINLKDAEDAVKYMPSLFVRKRNDGDNQAVLATRSWGLNSSARTLIYYDDLLISALIGNNNSGASPKWNLISPEAIGRIDFLNGPFAAAYPGNSIGGVLLISSKMPDKPFAVAKETVSVMPWSQYGTKDTYVTSQTSAAAGNRDGNLSWLVSANYLDSFQQPLSYVTFGATLANPTGTPPGTTGMFPAQNKQGMIANVVGAGTLAHSQQASGNLRLAWDVSPLVQATYSLGIWNNHQTSDPQTYLKSTATGLPTFAGISSFANSKYIWDQTHVSNAVALKSDTKGVFDFDLSASSYNYLQDIQTNPFTVRAGTSYSLNGKVTRMDGTNWQNADAKGIWRPDGIDGAHEVSFGVHGDRYRLENPVYASTVWYSTGDKGNGTLYSQGIGETRTGALWLQDAWKIVPNLKLTLGGRLETWRALDGFNLNTIQNGVGVITSSAAVNQPALSSTNFSPKASLTYDLNKEWRITGSFGEAYRYPTVTELYQNITVGGVATFANPFLVPEHDYTGELNIERRWNDGRVRLTLFRERTNNAIISQTNLVTNPTTGVQTPTTVISNVDAIRMQGVELSADKDNVLINGLQLFGSVTYVDSRILADASWAGFDPLTNLPTTVVGKRVPYVPDWRAKFGVTYRPNESWAYTVAARYSGKQYSTLDNTDRIPRVYGAFDNFFVVDLKIHYNATKNFSFDFGVDNLFNEQYFLFHPFPGRTFVLAAKYTF
ncbi:TonB-dependent receptor [Bradyrhizobium manausense]|uniref:TonB-dependent receptor n=1 Tax=Bradyrhizobium TaxID=374 RepID=UPI001BA6FB11|nr:MULTISPECIES: TonB-dependent receptor [Bradyrhizobium]MBR0829399.1 TonB-dependent receptor [Bradyrhizobium manausense]UVO25778.1 TonB-dependent receptor [Bradyrhizobium arachidis]